MSESPAQARTPRFELKPPVLESGKIGKVIARSDIVHVEMQVAAVGGETNLHAHTGEDGVWFVVSGRARFYTTKDELVEELGPHQGVIIPRNTPYWFESASDENLVLLHVSAKAQNEINKRIDYTEQGRPDLRAGPVILKP